jgi:hypothetical protein
MVPCAAESPLVERMRKRKAGGRSSRRLGGSEWHTRPAFDAGGVFPPGARRETFSGVITVLA